MSASLFSATTSTYDLLKEQYGPFLTIPQAAKIVGNHVSGWYKWIAEGRVPVPTIVIGGSRRIRLIDLCEFLDAQAQASIASQIELASKDGNPKRKRGRPRKFDAAFISPRHAPA